MDKVLVIGCNEVTDVIVPVLTGANSVIKELCIAGPDKTKSDVYKKYATNSRVRIVTAAVDLNNVERTMMMLNIFGPQMIVYLGEPELSLNAMNCALKVHAHYVDVNLLYNDINDPFVAKQFELYSQFRESNLTAVTGCGFSPAVLISTIRDAMEYDFDSVKNVDILDPKMADADDEDDGGDLLSDIIKLSQYANVVENGEVNQYPPFECKTSMDVDGIGNTDFFMFNNVIVNSFLKELPEIPNVRYFSTFNTKNLNLIKTLKNVGMLDKEPITVNGNQISPFDFISALLTSKDSPAPQQPEVEQASKPSVIHKNNLTKDEPVVTEKSEVKEEASRDAVKTKKNDNVISMFVTGRKGGEDKTLRYSFDCEIEGCEVDLVNRLSAMAVLSAVRFVGNSVWNKTGVYAPSRFDNRVLFESMKQDGLVVKTQLTEPLRLIGDNENVSKLTKAEGKTDETSDDKIGSEVKAG